MTLKAAGVLVAVGGLGAATVIPSANAFVGARAGSNPGASAAAAAVVAPAAPAPVQPPAGVLDLTVVAKPKPKVVVRQVARDLTPAASRDAARSAVPSQGGGESQLNRSNFSGTGTSGLTGNARRVFVSVMNNFPQITSVIGVRPDSIPDHPSGRAIDFMIPNWSGSGRATGDAIVSHVQANAGRWNVDYIIFRQRIWSPGSGWRFMSDRGSATANHYDHVHVSVN